MKSLKSADKRSACVLIVEDSEDARFIMKTELEWYGYTTVVAPDGETALRLLRHLQPDVIISDIQMPGMDGLEFLSRIRQNSNLADVPAIALTGFGGEREVKQALERGFSAQLTKPVEPAELVALIEKLLASKQGKGAGRPGGG
jgi:two-component system CheB/CheR fusion protein